MSPAPASWASPQKKCSAPTQPSATLKTPLSPPLVPENSPAPLTMLPAAVITSAGFGPGYKFFTHRLGHGIGLDGHEHPYLVRGSKTVLEPGMTFSNEPGIYIPGEFGMRCEDDMVIATNGPAQLLTPGFQVSLENPVG